MKLPFDFKISNVRMLLRVFAATLLAAIWIVTVYEIDAARKFEIGAAERDAKALARVLEEHTLRTVEEADQVATFLQHRYQLLGDKLNIKEELRSGLNPSDIYLLFSIIGENGQMLLSDKPFVPTNLADRAHFQVHARNDSGALFISKPVMGRVSKKWSIQMTRRLNHADGSFGGVVVVAVDLQYFSRLYQNIELGTHDSISLVGLDGTVRAHHTGDNMEHGQDVSGSALYLAARNNGNGVVRTRSVIDGRERIFAFRTLKEHPLYVTVGIDLEERLAPVRAMRSKRLLLAALMTAIILAFTAAVIALINQLMASREQALAASRAKSRFLSSVSHELRTPLTGILGYSELLKTELADAESSTYACAIHESGQRLLSQVDAMLELGALDDVRAVACQRQENVRNLLEQAMAAHAAVAAEKRLQYTLKVASEVPENIVCDARMLVGVLVKLLHNAITYTDEGAISLMVTHEDGQLTFAVSDTGRSVQAAARQQIFEAFSRASESDGRAKGGAGLGLAVAARMAELMGARIILGDAPGKGTVFSFSLPPHGDAPNKH